MDHRHHTRWIPTSRVLLLTSELPEIGMGQLREEFYRLAHPEVDTAITTQILQAGLPGAI